MKKLSLVMFMAAFAVGCSSMDSNMSSDKSMMHDDDMKTMHSDDMKSDRMMNKMESDSMKKEMMMDDSKMEMKSDSM